ncbi:MAG TPA: hypothetical protein VM933_10750 [Acidimicrobiales bacterium]|nr:hypothetical protein [Acidimicrobiales bacterium]
MVLPQAGRREALLQAKCKALVRSRWGDLVDADGAVTSSLPGGAALVAPEVATAWVLAEDHPERILGAALAWADRHGAAHLHVLATGGAGAIARRATGFARDVTVWPLTGATTSLADAEPATADPLPAEPPADPSTEPFIALIERAGAEAVVEAGILRAEVRGLEVARVEVDDEGPHLAVGVGKHDREAQREIRGRGHGVDELFEVVRIVAEHRIAEGAGHAAYHLAPERWLRSVVVRRPDLIGAANLHVRPSPVRREDLRQAAAAPAAGQDPDGAPVVAVCSVGTDADLVPSAVAAWLADGRQARLVVCVPRGDDHRMTRELVAALRVPAELRTVPPEWRTF